MRCPAKGGGERRVLGCRPLWRYQGTCWCCVRVAGWLPIPRAEFVTDCVSGAGEGGGNKWTYLGQRVNIPYNKQEGDFSLKKKDHPKPRYKIPYPISLNWWKDYHFFSCESTSRQSNGKRPHKYLPPKKMSPIKESRSTLPGEQVSVSKLKREWACGGRASKIERGWEENKQIPSLSVMNSAIIGDMWKSNSPGLFDTQTCNSLL